MKFFCVYREKLGTTIRFRNGFSLGFRWLDCNGRSSKTSAIIAGYHHPDSITWRWGLYWSKPSRQNWMPSVRHKRVSLPLLGSLEVQTQEHMFRRESTP